MIEVIIFEYLTHSSLFEKYCITFPSCIAKFCMLSLQCIFLRFTEVENESRRPY